MILKSDRKELILSNAKDINFVNEDFQNGQTL